MRLLRDCVVCACGVSNTTPTEEAATMEELMRGTIDLAPHLCPGTLWDTSDDDDLDSIDKIDELFDEILDMFYDTTLLPRPCQCSKKIISVMEVEDKEEHDNKNNVIVWSQDKDKVCADDFICEVEHEYVHQPAAAVRGADQTLTTKTNGVVLLRETPQPPGCVAQRHCVDEINTKVDLNTNIIYLGGPQ